MIERDASSQDTSVWWAQKSFWVVATGGFLALVIWVIPNWNAFVQNESEFPALWQIPGNRIVIAYLIIKMSSPLLIMGILALVLWIYELIQAEAVEVTEQREDPLRPITHMQTQQATPFLTAQQASGSTSRPISSEQTVSHFAVNARFIDPVTPLPPTIPSGEALRQQLMNTLPLEEISDQSLHQHSLVGTTYHGQSERTDGISLVSSSPLSLTLPQMGIGGVANGPVAAPGPLISICLLKDVTMAIMVPGGGRVVVPLTLNAKRVQLLAYIAWRRGELIDRDKILENIFGWGVNDEEATEEKLSERFESHKKLLRKKIREVVIEQVNRPAGKQIIDPEIDPFMSDAGFWGLSDICRVEDIEALERCSKVIAVARKDGKLVDTIPDFVKTSCEQLIASYSGDFLETVVKKYPGEFRAWQGRSSWVRKPYTHYRDYYLDALWQSAEYEWRMGQNMTKDDTALEKETNLRKQQEYFGRAAQQYQNYAMYACNSRFDSKASFGAHGEYGERVGMSERALRRCVVLLGTIGRTDLVNQVWSSYITQMKSVSDQRWQPEKKTLDDVAAAKAQTNAYRFGAMIEQMSREFADRQGHIS